MFELLRVLAFVSPLTRRREGPRRAAEEQFPAEPLEEQGAGLVQLTYGLLDRGPASPVSARDPKLERMKE